MSFADGYLALDKHSIYYVQQILPLSTCIFKMVSAHSHMTYMYANDICSYYIGFRFNFPLGMFCVPKH